jgi:hypothetical protein
MLNDSRWVDVGETVSELRTHEYENKLIATISYNEVYDNWQLEVEPAYLDDFVITFNAHNLDEAKWLATVKLNHHCNMVVGCYMKVRDHLPLMGELYDKAYK